MTRYIGIDIALEQDVIQTADASTAGPHASLDYLRGSNLLGAAAARLYGDLAGLGLAYDVFHGGRVRFHDALPLVGDRLALPAPFGWMKPKGASIRDGKNALEPSVLYAAPHLEEGEAGTLGLEQVRSGYFTRQRDHLSLEMPYRLKTSVDRDRRGRPRDGALFGYESIPAGTRWRTWIAIDPGVDERVAPMLRRVFDGKTLWLGRSRGAEYGRVRAELNDSRPPVHEPMSTTGKAVFYLLSDAALVDPETGEPTLTPRPTHFGLDDGVWTLDPVGSAVMTARGAPFNGRRGRRDVERPVIVRRSVVTFTSSSGATADVGLERGVGLHRAEGLGQVLVDPWFLSHKKIDALFEGAPAARVAPPAPRPKTGLAAWMVRRAEVQAAAETDLTFADEAARKLLGFVRQLDADQPRPTRAQWQRLAHQVQHVLDEPLDEAIGTLRRDVFDESARSNMWRGSVRGSSLADLTLSAGLGVAPATLAEFLESPKQHMLQGKSRERLTRLYLTAKQAAKKMSVDRKETRDA